MPIKHAFVSGKGAASDTTLVDGDNWDADHNAPNFDAMILNPQNASTWTNMGASVVELLGGTNHRLWSDLTYATQVRLVAVVTVVGATNAQLRLQYSTDSGSNWNYMDNTSGPQLPLNATGTIKSSWTTLHADAKADVMLRVVGIDGDGAADPSFLSLRMQYK